MYIFTVIGITISETRLFSVFVSAAFRENGKAAAEEVVEKAITSGTDNTEIIFSGDFQMLI